MGRCLLLSPGTVGVARYRFVTTWHRQRGGYVALVILIGLVGGLALGSIAAARRTASSYSAFLASTNPSDLTIIPAGGLMGYSACLASQIRRLPHVERVKSYVALSASLVRSGRVEAGSLNSEVHLVGSVDGLLFNQDKFTVTAGRMADPSKPNEVVVTETAAATLHLRLGQTLTVALSPTSKNGPARQGLAKDRRDWSGEPRGRRGPDRSFPHLHHRYTCTHAHGARGRGALLLRGAAARRRAFSSQMSSENSPRTSTTSPILRSRLT